MALFQLATCSYRAFTADMGIPVRASLGEPKHPVPHYDPRRRILELTPASSYFRASFDEFDRRFYGQLDKHGVTGITAALEKIANRSPIPEPTLVLLCFETVKSFTGTAEQQLEQEAAVCHRRMIARWWLANTGELIPELGRPEGAPTLW